MKSLSLLTLLSILSFSALADEQSHPFLSDTFTLSVGAFYPSKEIQIRVDGSLPNEGIGFDEGHGSEYQETTGSINFHWRFGERWSLWAQHWGTKTTNNVTFDEDVEWEDVVFSVGATAEIQGSAKISRVLLGRTFSVGPRHEFGFGAGLHWMEIGGSIEGQANIGDNVSEFYSDSVSASVPLPNIGGWYSYSLTSKLLFQARLDWFEASIGDYSGRLWNTQVGLNWQFFRHAGVGLYYNGLDLDADIDRSNWHGGFQTTQQGPFIAITASW